MKPRMIRWAGRRARTGQKSIKFWSENTKGRNHQNTLEQMVR